MMLELFAQANRAGGNPFAPGGGGGGAGGPDMAMLMVQIVVIGIGFLVGLAIQILFFLTLSKCLKRCDQRNRHMEPGEVWLGLIPCFNWYWNFQLAARIDKSLRDEFRDRGLRRHDDYGGKPGHTWALMTVLSLIPCVNYVTSVIALIYFIIYWVKIAGFSKELAEGPSFRNERYDDDYDDRDDNRRGGRRDDNDDEPRDPPPPRGHYDEGKDDPDDKPWRRK